MVVVDEAAQALEVATWGALLRARRAVLAGAVLPTPRLVSAFRSPLLSSRFSSLQFERLRLPWVVKLNFVFLWHFRAAVLT